MAQRTTETPPRGAQVIAGLSYRDWLVLASAALMAITLYLVYFWVPTEQNLGVSQRIFYFHVPLAIVGIGALVPVAVGSIGYLNRGTERWDSFAYASAEVGLVFATLGLVTGAIWAKPVWGQWWTWDAKLTLTAIIWFIYVAYMMVRAYAPKGSQGARFSAVVAVIGVLASVLNYLATSLWRTSHPETNIGPLADPADMIGSSEITATFLVALVTFLVLFIAMVAQRYSLKRTEVAVDEVHQHAS